MTDHIKRNSLFYAMIILMGMTICYFFLGAGNSKIRLVEKVNITLVEPLILTLTDANVDYTLTGTFNTLCTCGFESAGNGKLVYKGAGGAFMFNGVSDLKSNKGCDVFYTLYKNNVASMNITPTTFHNANSYNNISTTGIIELVTNDTLIIKAKSNTSSTILTINDLKLTLWGE